MDEWSKINTIPTTDEVICAMHQRRVSTLPSPFLSSHDTFLIPRRSLACDDVDDNDERRMRNVQR